MKNQSHDWIRRVPITHRGLHNTIAGVAENSRSAVEAAVAAGYAIEIDLQLSRDRVPIVFHDHTLDRMTAETGELRKLDASFLAQIKLGETGENLWTLETLLKVVDGKVGLIIELKGRVGEDDGFVAAVASLLKKYRGPAAIMSFSHWLLYDARQLAPELILGLTSKGGENLYNVNDEIAEKLNVDFVSYKHIDLDCRFVREFRQTGKPLISWTIKTPDEAVQALRFSDQITFEGFTP